MPKRKSKKYQRPRKLYDKPRIEEENILVKKYGLKNKREIWKADFALEKIRNVAKKLITASEEEKQKFIDLQKKKGFQVEDIADVLGLDKEDFLKRRLQSVLVKKGLCRTPRQARQMIAHKQIMVKGNILSAPSHLTTLEEEDQVELKLKKKIKKELTKEERELIKETKEAQEVEEEVRKETEATETEEVKENNEVEEK